MKKKNYLRVIFFGRGGGVDKLCWGQKYLKVGFNFAAYYQIVILLFV